MNENQRMFVRKIAYISFGTQALLASFVIGFSAFQLNRCPAAEVSNASGESDSPSCPSRALYSNMLTATLAYFFPSPATALIEAAFLSKEPLTRTPDSRKDDSPTSKGRSLRKKATEADAEVDKSESSP